MNTVVLASHECGFRGRYDSRARAEYALARHSCEKAHRDRAAARRGRVRAAAVDHTPKPCLHKLATHTHGTYVCHVLDRCRCLPCTQARFEYDTDVVHQKAYGTWTPFVPTAPALDHIRALQAAGLGWKRIAAAAGVPPSSVYPLLYGRPDRNAGAPRTKARRALVDAILAVPMPTLADLGATVVVDSTGTRRRLQALMTLGWSIQRIAATRGTGRQRLDHALVGRGVYASTARAVSAAYEALWNTTPPQDTTGDRIAAVRARNRARAAGWAPPMAWDDDAIDDPTATRAERRAAVVHLTARGLNDRTIAAQLHVSRDTVRHDREVLGIPSPRRSAA